MSADPITLFFSKLGRYPGNNKQWWQARQETDDPDSVPPRKAGEFLPEMLDKLFAGNMQAPRGHYIINAFHKDRSFVSGVQNIPVEVTNERPNTVCFFAGRAWYACNSTVYFSQVMTHRRRAGMCYQEADPTSEQISDLVATDGGVIPIPEASKIIRLIPNGGGVIVFAENGVWYITGSQSGFTAQDISVNKVSPIGCKAPLSIVDTLTAIYWWSDVGIMGMSQASGQYGPIPGAFDKMNISETTIQSLYNDIPDVARREAKGVYDPKANVIMWLYRDSEVPVTQYNRCLFFDTALEAFYPWKISINSNSPKVKGVVVSNRANNIPEIETDISPSQLVYLAIKGSDLRFVEARNITFVDWKQADGIGLPYSSYVETGYELMDDAMRNKNINYIFTYFRRTEDQDPSSCYLRVKFDWAKGLASNKWTSPIQAYRPIRVGLSEETNDEFGMVITKNKVRGNGKAIQFRLGTNEPGRNFDLQGWSVAISGNTSP